MFTLSLEPVQTLGLCQTMTPEQRLEHLQELRLQMSSSIGLTRLETFGQPVDLLAKAVDLTVQCVSDARLADAVRGFFQPEDLRRAIIESAGSLVNLTPRQVEMFVSRYLYKANDGRFSSSGGKQIRLDLGTLTWALTQPEEIRREIDGLTKAMRDGLNVSVERMRELRLAVRVAKDFSVRFKLMVRLLSFALNQTDASGEKPLGDFLREMVVLSRLDFIVSERLIKRFVARFSRAARRSAESMTDAFLNLVGEYVLIGMGVVTPEIFGLGQFEIDRGQHEFAMESLKSIGMDIDVLMNYYNLKTSGRVFFSRYALAHVHSTAVTEAMIRRFIIETVRADSRAILLAADFPGFFREVRENIGRFSDPEDLRETLAELFVSKMNSNDFQIALRHLIKNRWLAHLAIFAP